MAGRFFHPLTLEGITGFNVLKPHLQTTIWTLLRSGVTQREIERRTGIYRHTIRSYLKKFDIQARTPGIRSDSSEPDQTAPPWPATPLALPAPPNTTAVLACEPHRTSIEAQLKLRLNAMAIYQDPVDGHSFAGARVMQGQSNQAPFLETFAAMLQDELDRRRSRLTERRFKLSALDERLGLADFDWRFNPKLPRQACFELQALKFISEGSNALIIGKPGSGKSHVAKAVAYQVTLQRFSVRYLEADTEFARFGLASQAEQAQILRSYVEPDLLVLDDLFLARRIADVSAELLQAIVHQRYKLRRSIIVTSNRVVQDWGKYLGDVTMASPILDRLMHRASMLEFMLELPTKGGRRTHCYGTHHQRIIQPVLPVAV